MADESSELTAYRLKGIDDRLSIMEGKIDSILVTRREFAEMDKRVSNVESNLKWAVLLVMGSVISAVVGTVLIR